MLRVSSTRRHRHGPATRRSRWWRPRCSGCVPSPVGRGCLRPEREPPGCRPLRPADVCVGQQARRCRTPLHAGQQRTARTEWRRPPPTWVPATAAPRRGCRPLPGELYPPAGAPRPPGRRCSPVAADRWQFGPAPRPGSARGLAAFAAGGIKGIGQCPIDVHVVSKRNRGASGLN